MIVDLKNASRLISPRPTFLVSTIDKKVQLNLAPFSWVFPVSFEPSLICLAIDKRNKHTLLNIKKTKEFVLNLITEEFAQQAINSLKLNLGDAWEKISLHEERSQRIKCPAVKESKIRLECKLHKIINIKEADHYLIIGKVLHAYCSDTINGKYPNLNQIKPLMHVSGTSFRKIGEEIILER